MKGKPGKLAPVTDTLFLADFRRAVASPYCPFCALLRETTQRYLRSLLNELVLAPDIHQQLAQAHGLCGAHTEQLREQVVRQGREGGGVAILYTTVLQSLRAALTAGLEEVPTAPIRWRRRTVSLGERLRAQLQPTSPCLVCEHQRRSEAYALGQLIEALGEDAEGSALAGLYRESAGACLNHFQRLLAQNPEEATVRWLAVQQQAQWDTLEAQLEGYRRGERAVESWERALAQLSTDGF